MTNVLSFEQEWVRACPKRIQILRFIREAIDVKETSWDMITKVNLIKVANYIKGKVAANSARTYFAEICAFLHNYDEEGIIPCRHPEEVLKAKKVPQQNVALTESELKLIENYYDKLWTKKGHQCEKDVLTLFLLEAFCGARSGDVEELTTANIQDGRLMYVSEKTHTLATIPAHRRLQQLLERKPTTVYSGGTKNRTIKRVAKKVGITQIVTIYYRGKMHSWPKYRYLGTHSARRSFASVLSAKGVPTAEISQYMGHSDIAMTNRYIKVESDKASAAALSFFNG